VEEWRAKDPLARTRGFLSDSEADLIDQQVEQEMQEALTFALSSEKAGVDSIFLGQMSS
jgi:TPP-dependent pyruvate/acetoin dehydrogenase alpha subunit